ncbi:hypothetical protein [Agromyces seonyuensis]|uniref:Uncharacterized protein n=1 Tax=Agromyces seonyuensis TaxID=2662446 RepID=A0A6I4NT92_9MICO|nr:hypothetical protein [Agromyces seonyuensis]MWB97658.1 hypothetical protein [Agromyces seonyuensis]
MVEAIRREGEENTAASPTEPGLYRLPCGSCYVELWIGSDGEEHWSVPGNPIGFTRESISLCIHGPRPWTRLHTLAEASQIFAARIEGGATIDELVREYEEAEAADA